TLCSGTASVSVTGGTGLLTYSWDDPAAQTNTTAIGLCPGSYIATITDDEGCILTENFALLQPAGLLGDIIPISACDGAGNISASASVNPTSGTAPFTYVWDDAANQLTQTAIGLTIGQTYSVVVFDASGCQLDASTTIPTPICEIVVPNTFSPNDDSFNDTWYIESLSTYTQCKVKVYNRWGDIVFKSTGYDEPWDGKYANIGVPAAVYYYVIEVSEIDQNYHGSVTVVR
ncbi:MAG: gliding motility-associated C-terminal domain-containing protein, partial [Flavobacteriales bacterium]|nr:gliding motility-associated C-terminal domain-containing protein [Flavobacteriales bacterium]